MLPSRVQPETACETFTRLRDQLAENTLAYWQGKPLATEAWAGMTRGVEFTRQCRSLYDFERKWVSRQQMGLGLADYWSVYAGNRPRPNPVTESETVMRIYKCLLYAAGAEQEYTAFEKDFASFAITESAIRKARKSAAAQPL